MFFFFLLFFFHFFLGSLDKYVHDYMIKKNMHEAAEIFVQEDNLGEHAVGMCSAYYTFQSLSSNRCIYVLSNDSLPYLPFLKNFPCFIIIF